MKDRLLFGTIGILVGVVVMQWSMPHGPRLADAVEVQPPIFTKGLVLCDDNGAPQLLMTVDKDEIVIRAQRAERGAELDLRIGKDDATLKLIGSDGKGAGITLIPGVSSVALMDGKKPLVMLLATSNESDLILNSPTGKLEFSAMVKADSAVVLLAKDRNGTRRLGLALAKGGNPCLSFFDAAGRPRTLLGALEGYAAESSLILFDETGNVSARLP